MLLPQVAHDFGVILDENEELVARVTPLSQAAADLPWAGVPWAIPRGFAAVTRIPNRGAAPEEFLLAELVDGLGHMLLERNPWGQGARTSTAGAGTPGGAVGGRAGAAA